MRPIIFSWPLVAKILAGQKTVTRRLVKANLNGAGKTLRVDHVGRRDPDGSPRWYAEPGGWISPRYFGRMYVRECWGGDDLCGYAYRADHPDWPRFQGDGEQPDAPWKSARFMPAKAARLFLSVTDVRPERLHAITEAEAIAEGIEPDDETRAGHPTEPTRIAFLRGFCKLNGLRVGSDPWVWRIAFDVEPG